MTIRQFFLFLLLATPLPYATAQEYPTKPIRLIVQAAPGTDTDIVSRAIAPLMEKTLGQPLIVENKPGANGLIAYDFVARQAPADGYTIVMGSVGSFAALPLLVKDLKFDPVKDLPPIADMVELRLLLGVNAALPLRTFDQFVSYAKANPGKLNYGSNVAVVRVPMEMIIDKFGLSIVHIPYTTAAQFTMGFLTGDIQTGVTTERVAVANQEKIRVLATTGDKRSASFPEVPTFKELGFPDIYGSTTSLNARAGTPKPILDKLHAAATAALANPALKSQLAASQIHVVARTQAEAQASLVDQTKKYAQMAQRLGLKAE